MELKQNHYEGDEPLLKDTVVSIKSSIAALDKTLSTAAEEEEDDKERRRGNDNSSSSKTSHYNNDSIIQESVTEEGINWLNEWLYRVRTLYS